MSRWEKETAKDSNLTQYANARNISWAMRRWGAKRQVRRFAFCLIVFYWRTNSLLPIQLINSHKQQTHGADRERDATRRERDKRQACAPRGGQHHEGSNQTHQMKWQLISKVFSGRLAAKSEQWSEVLSILTDFYSLVLLTSWTSIIYIDKEDA